MSGQVRVILNQDGLKVTRDPAFAADDGSCEHQLTRDGGFQNASAVCRAVSGAEGVHYAYISRFKGVASIFYGLSNDDQANYEPVARNVVAAVRALA